MKNEGYCEKCEGYIEQSPFPEQHCHQCEMSIGRLHNAKREVLRRRPPADSKDNKGEGSDNSILTEEEMKRVKKLIPDDIQHLDTCPAVSFPTD